MTEKKYPEEIYKDAETGGEHFIPRFRETLEKAYDLGYKHGQKTQEDPLTGWSNLTEAIKAGERIDWEKLDSLEAKCVHPEMGTLTYKMERDEIGFRNNPGGWYIDTSTGAWKQAFYDSWMGFQGWALYIKGDLPLRKLTADQLEPGTCFMGRERGGVRGLYIRYSMPFLPVGKSRERACPLSASFTVPAEDIEVLHVYEETGTFEKPEGDA